MLKSCSQFAIIRDRSASTFEEKLNARLEELIDNDPSVTFADADGDMIARISFTKKVEFEREVLPKSETGIRFTCGDCPNLTPILTQKGTVDGRVKYGNCPYARFGRSFRSTPACDVLYNMIENGEVRLCLSESE